MLVLKLASSAALFAQSGRSSPDKAQNRSNLDARKYGVTRGDRAQLGKRGASTRIPNPKATAAWMPAAR
jgi:hypothetical protein